MTTDLISVVPAVVGDQTVQTVDGRDLHAFLEVKTQFKDWIVRRIEEYGFEEDKDFSPFLSETSDRGFSSFLSETSEGWVTQNSVKSQGGRPAKEYTLTLDMAKELAMVERTDKGREVRRYFIECERMAKESLKNIPWPKPLSAMESDRKLAPYKMQFEEFPLHVYVTIGNIPWFCAPDIARILDFNSWRSMRTEVGWCDEIQLEIRTASGIKRRHFIDLATVQRAIQQQRIEFRTQRFEDWLLDAAMPVLQRINTSAHEPLKKAIRELLQSPEGGVIRRQIAHECVRLGLLD